MQKVSYAPAMATSLRELRERHEEIERRLATLDRHLALSSDEQAERIRLKKERLWVKDRIFALAGAGPGLAAASH